MINQQKSLNTYILTGLIYKQKSSNFFDLKYKQMSTNLDAFNTFIQKVSLH